MNKHLIAAEHARRGFEYAYNRPPTRAERQVLQGIALLESGYGRGWRGAGKGSNNMGAIQAGHPPCDPGKSFEYTDTSPTSSGGSIPYRICFRKYATPVEGFADLARVAYGKRPTVLQMAAEGDLYGVSRELRRTKYYEGFGKTQEERVANHHRALLRCVVKIARALGEPMPDGAPMPPRVLRWKKPPMRGEDVRRLQRALVLEETGIYDKFTRDTVMMFQASRPGMKVDGIVGHGQTWPAIYELEKVGEYLP